MTVVVNPANANLVFIGGTNIYRSTNGFSSTAGTTRIGGYLNATGAAQYNVGGVTHHSDIHDIVFALATMILYIQAQTEESTKQTLP
ncbi:MAG: hypothetical protein R3E32_01870 [Chitinophagales bacterium]